MIRVSITIPVFNEEACLSGTLMRLQEFLSQQAGFEWEIVIADNGSTDRTHEIADQFRMQNAECKTKLISLPEKGRGRALKHVWLNSDAEILAYMDADLSTDLEALPKFIESLVSGHYDLATGSRLLIPQLTTRCFKREFISRCYNLLIKAMFRTTFSDAQCGFKAITREAAQDLLRGGSERGRGRGRFLTVQDNGWFFDTELLILAERQGYRIFDLPVRWTERRESHVRILRTAFEDLKGLLRLRRTREFQISTISNLK